MSLLSYLLSNQGDEEPSQGGAEGYCRLRSEVTGSSSAIFQDKCREWLRYFKTSLTYSSAASATQSAALPSSDCPPRAYSEEWLNPRARRCRPQQKIRRL